MISSVLFLNLCLLCSKSIFNKDSLLPCLNLSYVINVNHVNENKCDKKIGLNAEIQLLVHACIFFFAFITH